MRKIKSTALLGAFVAVASVGVISHEAHGGTIVIPPNGAPTIISKEMLPNTSASLQASIDPGVGITSGTIKLTISGAYFAGSYTISGAGGSCATNVSSATTSLTFTNCSVTANTAYPIESFNSSNTYSYFSVSVPASSSSIVLTYSSNVGDTSTSTIAVVQQQLTVTPHNAVTTYIDPSSLSTFIGGGNVASNYVVLSNNEYGNNSTWSNTINVNANTSYTMNFVFTGIPGSVSSVSALFNGSSATPVNGSATVSSTLINISSPFSSSSSAMLSFDFSNSNNVDIQTGTISLSSITGLGFNGNNSVSYPYLPAPQNFLTFALGATEIYIPDALAHSGSNVITDGYITISMPSSASIASISVLNNPSASCPTNGILTSTSTPNLYYIDLNTLASLCTGLNPTAWQAGVPLVIYISGTNASASNITADAYAVFNGMLKRIPVNVVNIGSGYANFNY